MTSPKYTRRLFFNKIFSSFLSFSLLFKTSDLIASCTSTKPSGVVFADPNVGIGKITKFITDASKTIDVKFKSGSKCSDCKFYVKDSEKMGFAPCLMMSSNYVLGCGWCTLFTNRPIVKPRGLKRRSNISF